MLSRINENLSHCVSDLFTDDFSTLYVILHRIMGPLVKGVLERAGQRYVMAYLKFMLS